MSTMLVKNSQVLVTMDAGRREIPGGGLYIEDGVIRQVGKPGELPEVADQILDLRDHVVMPGLVNTHHHLYQTLTRAVTRAQDGSLFTWLDTLYPIWARITPDAVYSSALAGLAELMLSGCTTTADHLYLVPNGSRHDDEIRAARQIGIRFHPTRGSMSLGKSNGGLPPDSVTQTEEEILYDSRRLIEEYHDPKPYSMCRVGLAPCSPFSVTPELMLESARLARAYGVRLHTHLAETSDEEAFCLGRFGMRPVDYAESLEWLGEDVWVAHSVHVSREEMARFARTGTGVAHCATSNMASAAGIAPVSEMVRAGVRVGLGVDGSAYNDTSHMMREARQAMLLQRVRGDPTAMTARQALEMATLGGAATLGRDDIGSLEPGKAADLVAVNMNQLAYAGAHDLVAATLFCDATGVDLSIINGRIVVQEGRLATVDLMPVIEHHNQLSRSLMAG